MAKLFGKLRSDTAMCLHVNFQSVLIIVSFQVIFHIIIFMVCFYFLSSALTDVLPLLKAENYQQTEHMIEQCPEIRYLP
jgi:hypothetical protein